MISSTRRPKAAPISGARPSAKSARKSSSWADVAELVEPGIARRPDARPGQGQRLAVVLDGRRWGSARPGPRRRRWRPGSRAPASASRQLVSTRAVQPAGEGQRDLGVGVHGHVVGRPRGAPAPTTTRSSPPGPASASSSTRASGWAPRSNSTPPPQPSVRKSPQSGRPCSMRASTWRSGPRRVHQRGGPHHDGGEGQVLGVAEPAAGGRRRADQRVGVGQGGGQGLLDDHRRARRPGRPGRRRRGTPAGSPPPPRRRRPAARRRARPGRRAARPARPPGPACATPPGRPSRRAGPGGQAVDDADVAGPGQGQLGHRRHAVPAQDPGSGRPSATTGASRRARRPGRRSRTDPTVAAPLEVLADLARPCPGRRGGCSGTSAGSMPERPGPASRPCPPGRR